ncbi:MAG: DUF2905 domain-containing protein [Armatimonadota bacterium]|nr:DUF2905 domain-containing protein [Armatimonadota bacterium]
MGTVTPLQSLGRMLMVMGALLFIAGVMLTVAGRVPRLPGDIVIERPNLTVFIPLGWMIVVSVVLTILLNILIRR